MVGLRQLIICLVVVAVVFTFGGMQPHQRLRDFHPAAADMLSTAAGTSVEVATLSGEMLASAAGAMGAVMADVSSLSASQTGEMLSSTASAIGAAASSAMDAVVGSSPVKRDETADALLGFRAFVANSQPAGAEPASREVAATTATAPGLATVAREQPAIAVAATGASTTPSAAGATSPSAHCNHEHSAVLSLDDVLCRVPRGALAFVSLANGAYAELGINWALLLLPLLGRAGAGHEDRAFLYAIDEAAVTAFTQRKLPTVRQTTEAKHNPLSHSSDGFRWEPGAFRDYGVTKADVILHLLRAGRDVCFSDVDAAWVAPPYDLLASVPEADVLSGTDCLHVPWDSDRSTREARVKGCGHQPGARSSAWFNTGVMLFRANGRAIDLMAEWRQKMASIKGDAQIDDQLTFNQLVGTVWSTGSNRIRTFYPIKAASRDGRVIFDGNGTRRIHAMQANTICSAHVYHVQQSATARGCLVLHLTFVEGWPKNPAKYWRLREAGLLAVSPEGLGARYLSFTPPQPKTIPPDRSPDLGPTRPNGQLPDRTSDGKGWPVATALRHSPRLAAHLDMIDRNIAALRNAMGIAKALGRELIMPRMPCLCERAEGPTALLPSCVLDGASTPVPHVCPLESVFDVARVERLWQEKYLQLRPWTLLNSSIHKPAHGEQPFDLARDMVTVRWNGDAAAASRYDATQRQVWLPQGGSDVQIKEGLAATGVADARVLHLDFAEGAFGGFEAEATARVFQQKIANYLLGGWSATWCCTSWDKPRGTINFKRPIALPSGAQARAGVQRPPEVPARRPCYWRDCDESGHQK